MKISEKWLRTLVNPNVTTDKLCEQLTMAGLEVESVTPVTTLFKDVLIGEILEVEKHPDADRLRVCKVNVGEGSPLQIVCGAANVRVGLKVPVAVLGATLKDGTKIKRAKLRGVESEGMLCSATELGLAEVSNGLLELAVNAPLGMDFTKYIDIDDTIIDINITPNRGDCLSMMGIAREVSTLNNCQMEIPSIAEIKDANNSSLEIKVTAKNACPRYIARSITNININVETPAWLKTRITALGMRPVNPVVDVMNYVMLELGQPLHAFDLDKINNKIEVRFAKENEELLLLGGNTIKLTENDLCIADEGSALALAGIMGGKNSEVTLETKDILLESAFFTPEFISKSVQKHDLHTEASYRFERGVDFALQIKALNRATLLLLEIVGGTADFTSEVITNEFLPVPKEITLSINYCNKFLGTKFTLTEVESIFKRLCFTVRTVTSDEFVVLAPSFRFDINTKVDLIEEIARIYGYANILESAPIMPVLIRPSDLYLKNQRKIADLLIANGYQEVINYSFGAPQSVDDIKLSNPISAELSVMRPNLWSGLLNTIYYNQNHKQVRMRFFEIGTCFINDENKNILQPIRLAGAVTGGVNPEQWGGKTIGVDFFDIKKDVENIFKLFDKESSLEFLVEKNEILHPTASARIYYNKKPVGYLGKIHPNIQNSFEITKNVCLFEIDLSFLNKKIDLKFKNISKFPFVERDIALLVKRDIKWFDIKNKIWDVSGELLKDVRLFDVYEGDGILSEEKSLALHLIFQDVSRTLVEDEVEVLLCKIINNLEQSFNAKLRG